MPGRPGAGAPARLAAALALVACATPAPAGQQAVDIGPTRIAGQVASYRELRDRGVVKQRYDFSCGAAAFATLLRFGFGEAIDEEEVLRALFADASKVEQRLIENKGLSLLDMQRLAAGRGYRAQAFRLAPDQLPRLPRPVIVFIRPRGYDHFAVLKGVRQDRAYLADPSQGNWVLPLPRFLDMWLERSAGRGVIFVVERPDGRWPLGSSLAPPPAGVPRAPPLPIRDLLEVAQPAAASARVAAP